jgi:hypothetical protein
MLPCPGGAPDIAFFCDADVALVCNLLLAVLMDLIQLRFLRL